jgi:hypothetical protein
MSHPRDKGTSRHSATRRKEDGMRWFVAVLVAGLLTASAVHAQTETVNVSIGRFVEFGGRGHGGSVHHGHLRPG